MLEGSLRRGSSPFLFALDQKHLEVREDAVPVVPVVGHGRSTDADRPSCDPALLLRCDIVFLDCQLDRRFGIGRRWLMASRSLGDHALAHMRVDGRRCAALPGTCAEHITRTLRGQSQRSGRSAALDRSQIGLRARLRAIEHDQFVGLLCGLHPVEHGRGEIPAPAVSGSACRQAVRRGWPRPPANGRLAHINDLRDALSHADQSSRSLVCIFPSRWCVGLSIRRK